MPQGGTAGLSSRVVEGRKDNGPSIDTSALLDKPAVAHNVINVAIIFCHGYTVLDVI
jgi:hypothetical protein